MSLTLHVIPASTSKGLVLQRIALLDEAPTVERLVRAVGGPLRVIPDFTTILRDGKAVPCLAVCNGLDQGDPHSKPNAWANLLWLQAQVRDKGFSEANTTNAVRGTVAILWGADITLADLH